MVIFNNDVIYLCSCSIQRGVVVGSKDDTRLEKNQNVII